MKVSDMQIKLVSSAGENVPDRILLRKENKTWIAVGEDPGIYPQEIRLINDIQAAISKWNPNQ